MARHERALRLAGGELEGESNVLRLAIGQPSAGRLLAQDIRHEEWLAMSEPFGSPKAS
jgi:hypothetical protein